MAESERAKGTVSYGLTVNLGNYNSARFDATLEFYLDEKTHEQAFAEVKQLVKRQASEGGA